MQMILALWIITEREDAWLIWPLPCKNTHVHMQENNMITWKCSVISLNMELTSS